MKETKTELEKELDIIKKWEEDQLKGWFWEKIGQLPFTLLDKITPQFIHKKIGQLLDELGNFVQTGGQYLTNQENVLKHYQVIKENEEVTLEIVSKQPIAVMKDVAKKITKKKIQLATVQGASTGFGGVFTLAIDIPFVLGISLKTLQEIALCYGYDPRNKEERLFILKCLQYSSSDVVGKKAIAKELMTMDEDDSRNQEIQAISKIQGWREVVLSYRETYGLKKLFQAIPIVGMIIGVFLNRSMVKDVAEVGEMLYKKRRIMERLKDIE